MTDLFLEAEARYQAACERRGAVVATWESEGKPLLATGSTGQLVEHPLVRQLNDLDRLCDALGRALQRKQPGRDPVAVVRASVGSSPAAKLRRVK